ncbi:MAG: TonB-dependent receptor [Bacteroides sp.]
MKPIYTSPVILALALLALPAGAQTQQQSTQVKDTTVNRTVVVEQTYTPILQDASKINVLPRVEAPTVSQKEVEYATTWAPASQFSVPYLKTYPGKEQPAATLPGFIRAGYGNYGNIDLLGSYLFRPGDKDRLGVSLRMEGMNGELTDTKDRDWDAYSYHTRANVDYTHLFRRVDLNVAGNFGLNNFNLLPGSEGKQKFTSGDMHLGVQSTDETLPLQFSVETNLLRYSRQRNDFFGTGGGTDETAIRTHALVSGAINDEQRIALDVTMNNLFYHEDSAIDHTAVFSNRTLVDLRPHYTLATDDWQLRLGAHVDLSFGAGKAVRIAPDVEAVYRFANTYLLYVQATGGRQLNDLRRLEQLHPYALYSAPIADGYEQVLARIGFKASPAPGLWLNIFGGYQCLKDDLVPVEQQSTQDAAIRWADYTCVSKTDNFYAGVQASYTYKDCFTLSADGVYTHWKADTDAALLQKPQSYIALSVEGRPTRALRLNASYRYTQWAYSGTGSQPALHQLSAGASYTVFRHISLYTRVNNLLNKRCQSYYLLPTQGTNFVGGLSFQF